MTLTDRQGDIKADEHVDAQRNCSAKERPPPMFGKGNCESNLPLFQKVRGLIEIFAYLGRVSYNRTNIRDFNKESKCCVLYST